jgi:hypothetical protein
VLTADARIGRVGWLVFVQSPISEALAPVYGALVSGITDDQLGQRPTSPTSDGRCWRASRVPAVAVGYLETAARRPWGSECHDLNERRLWDLRRA